MQENNTGIEPEISIKQHFFLSLEVSKNFWKLLKQNNRGNQFTNPKRFKYFWLWILFIEFWSIKLTKLLRIKKRKLIKNKILYLSFRKVFKSFLIFNADEINNKTIPIDRAEGKRNNPL